jgi:hypothetical protein
MQVLPIRIRGGCSEGSPKRWNRGAVVAAEIEALPAIGNSANQDRFTRPEVIGWIGLRQFSPEVPVNRHQVEDRRREVTDLAAFLVGDIARHGERLEVDLGSHDRRPETEHGPALEAFDRMGEQKEIVIAGRAQRRTVTVRMLMNNVVADTNMNRGRDRAAMGSRQHAELAMGVIALKNVPADAFPNSLAAGIANPIVQLAGLLPQPELPSLDVARNTLRGGADSSQLIVVNNARPVHCHMGEETSLQQVDDVAIHARPQDVGSHHEHDSGAFPARFQEPFSDRRQIGVFKGRSWIVQLQPVLDGQVMRSLRQGL